MFSLLSEGGRLAGSCVAAGAKNEETFDKALSPGDRIDGVLGGVETVSNLIQGPVDFCSETADRTGDTFSTSFCPSA